MGKSVFIYVNNDGDYDALSFEQHYNTQKVYEEMVAAGVKKKNLPDLEYGEDEGITIRVEIKEFGEVDPEFESFITDKLCDYDQLKARNIYRVEPV
jgi:hypothetical protein